MVTQKSPDGILLDKTIVEVEKEAITLLELDAHSRIQIVISEGPESLYKLNDSGFINSMINLMINRELVAQELKKDKKFKPNIYMKDADNLFIKIKAKFHTPQEFEKFLSEINMSEIEFKKTLAIYIMIDSYINQIADEKIKIDEDELNKYMQSNGVILPADTETQNRYKNILKAEKKKNFAAQYLDELKNKYRIRYLYTPQ
ncbi:MAG: hypothetical protein ACP5QK_00965 [Myxococcota bacterium]